MNNMREGGVNVVDLFSGCGGISEGLTKVRGHPYRIVFANDWNKQAAAAFKYNHSKTEVSDDDVKNLTGEKILRSCSLKKGEIDMIVGGPPCQGFSMAGNRFMDDPRNRYFKEFIRIVNELNPSVVFMENVPQFATLWDGIFGFEVVKTFEKLGYKTEMNFLLASDYGIPQIRRRVFFIAAKNNFQKERITFPLPTHEKIENALELMRGNTKRYKNKALDGFTLKKFISF